MIEEDDSREEILEIITMDQEMDPCLDSWTSEIVIAIALLSNHAVVLGEVEVTSTTLAEVGDEVTLTAVAEVEEAEEEVKWVVEDLKIVVEEAEEEVEVEEVEDSLMIEEVETVAGQTLEVEAEVEIDENPFEVWMNCHRVMATESDPVNCHHEEMDHEICHVMDQFEMDHEEKKCSGTAHEESHRDETTCQEMVPETYHDETNLTGTDQEICLEERNPSEMDRATFLEEMNLLEVCHEMDLGGMMNLGISIAEKDLRQEMNQEEMVLETLCTMMDQ